MNIDGRISARFFFKMARTPILVGKYVLPCDRPLVVGIVNVTPDSFSDGGKYVRVDAAVAHALKLIDEGADILDIGGESTRPGAAPVSRSEEIERILPVVEALAAGHTPISVDTQKPQVMAAAIRAGASMINDVNALQADGAIDVCAANDVAVCLMHMQGTPGSMQSNPTYVDIVADVEAFLLERTAACLNAGIDRARIVIDPGIGFGKSLEHNLALLRATRRFADTGFAVMVGVSRKSMFKTLLKRAVDDRLVPSVVVGVLAVQQGASMLRVHDVRETQAALRVWQAVMEQER